MPKASLVWCTKHSWPLQKPGERATPKQREQLGQRAMLGLLNAFCEMPGIFEEAKGNLENIPALMLRHAPTCCYCKDKIEGVVTCALLGRVYGQGDNLITPARPS